MSEQPEQRDSRQQFAGRLLVTMGVLIIFVAGSCSIYFGIEALPLLSDPSARHIGEGILSMVVVAGGIPLLLGVLFVYFGRKTLRKSRVNSNPPIDRG